jgi:hypothetical protein
MGDRMGPGSDSEPRITDITPEARHDRRNDALEPGAQAENAPVRPDRPEPVREEEQVEEITQTDQQLIMTRKKEFDDLFKYMKRYQDEGLSVLDIQNQSKRLKGIFNSWREVFMAAGISRERTSKMIKIAVDEARQMRSAGGLMFQFEKRMFTRGKMAERTPILKFFKSFVKGLKGELDEEAAAEERQEQAPEERFKQAA